MLLEDKKKIPLDGFFNFFFKNAKKQEPCSYAKNHGRTSTYIAEHFQQKSFCFYVFSFFFQQKFLCWYAFPVFTILGHIFIFIFLFFFPTKTFVFMNFQFSQF